MMLGKQSGESLKSRAGQFDFSWNLSGFDLAQECIDSAILRGRKIARSLTPAACRKG